MLVRRLWKKLTIKTSPKLIKRQVSRVETSSLQVANT